MPIRLIISNESWKLFVSIKNVECSAEDWNNNRQEIKEPKKGADYNFFIEYNKILTDKANFLIEFKRNALLKGIRISKSILKEMLNENSAFSTNNSFFEVFDLFLEKNKSNYTPGTLKTYKTARRFLMDFQKASKMKIEFHNIDLNFFDSLKIFAFGQELQNNYVATLIRRLKRFLNWSLERNFHDYVEFKKFSFSESEVEVIYLTIDELMLLYGHKFTSDKLERVRDLFCFACFTGLRFSDLSNLQNAEFFDDYFKITIKKTKTTDHIIPLSHMAKSLLNIHNYNLYKI